METIKPGHYVLTRDVENPNPDRRRVRDVLSQPVWQEGTRIYVRHWRSGSVTLEWVRRRYARADWRSDAGQALISALAPCSEDTDGLFKRLELEDGRPENVLRFMVDTGRLSPEALEAIVEHYLADLDAQEAADEARGIR